MRTKTPGPTGAWSASLSFTGGQVSKRRSCISRSDNLEERPGSPERPRTLGPPGSPIGSTGIEGIARLCADFAGLVSTGSSKTLEGRPFTGLAGSALRDAELAGELLGASPLRRLRPPRRPRRRRFLSGESEDSAAGVPEASSGSVPDSTVTVEDSDMAEVSSGACAGSGSATDGGVNIKSPEEWAGSRAAASAPSLTAASCALVFQSARRKRSAAARYHLAASGF